MNSVSASVGNSTEDSNKADKKTNIWWMVIGIIFVASMLRAPINGVGPIVGLLKSDLHLSNTSIGLVTTLPLLAFAFFSPIVPKLSQKYGVSKTVLYSLSFLFIGLFIRSVSGVFTLFLGTMMIGIAISVGNVLLPGIIKSEFPAKIGLMTSVYIIAMNLGGAISSGISAPIAVGFGFGWQGALGVWGVLAIVALLCWLPQARNKKITNDRRGNETNKKRVSLWRCSLSWQVTLFMGLQSMIFFVLIAWLPEILIQRGLSSNEAGCYLSLLLLTLLPFNLTIPVLAGRMKDQRLLVTISGSSFLFATLGLLYGNLSFMIVWIIVYGIAGGFSFSLSMMFFALRTKNAYEAAELSGMAQSVGYLLAAIGPTLFGFLYDVTNSWTLPLYILAGSSILLFMFGYGAAKDRYVQSTM